MNLRGNANLIFLFLTLMLVGLPINVAAQAEDAPLAYSLNRIELHVRINGDGTLDVVESQVVSVEQGSLFSGFQNLSLRQMDGIEAMSVEADGRLLNLDDSACAFCYWTVIQPRQPDWVYFDRVSYDLVFNPDSMGQVQTFWDFPGIGAGENANFVLRYRVLGAIQIFADSQRFIWDVTPGFAVPVAEAQMFITPPPGLAAEDLIIEAGPAESEIDEFGRIALQYEGAVPAATHWFVNVTMPAAATAAELSNWQQELDNVVAAAETARATERADQQALYLQQSRQRFVALGFTILILVGASFLLRRRRQGSEPDEHPLAGLPAALLPFVHQVDEAIGRSLLAQFMTLSDVGLLTVGDEMQITRRTDKLRERAGWTLPSGERIKLQPALVTMYQAVPAGTAPWQVVRKALAEKLDAIVEDMLVDAEEVIALLPKQRHERWLKAAIGIAAVGLVALLGTALSGLSGLGWIAFAPGFALLMVSGLIYYQNNQQRPKNPDPGQLVTSYRARLNELRTSAEGDLVEYYLFEAAANIIALNEVDTVTQAAAQANIGSPDWVPLYPLLLTEFAALAADENLAEKLTTGYNTTLAEI